MGVVYMGQFVVWKGGIRVKTVGYNLKQRVSLVSVGILEISPGRGALKLFWDDILNGVRLNHKGIYVDNYLVTNTVPFF